MATEAPAIDVATTIQPEASSEQCAAPAADECSAGQLEQCDAPAPGACWPAAHLERLNGLGRLKSDPRSILFVDGFSIPFWLHLWSDLGTF